MILPPSPTGELWLLKIAVEAALVGLLLKRRLATKYVGLMVYLLVAVAKSLTILYAMQSPGGYYPMWVRTHWLTIGAQGVLTMDLLIIYAQHFRGIASFATVMYTAFIFAALYGSGFVYQIGTRWWSRDVQMVASHTKYYGLALCAVLLLARVFIWLYRHQVTVATNARRISLALALVMSGAVVGNCVPRGLTSDACTVGVPLLAWAWLAFRLRQEGEDGLCPPPASPEDRDRWERENRERERQLLEKIKLAQKFR